jgi:hypothetical protein
MVDESEGTLMTVATVVEMQTKRRKTGSRYKQARKTLSYVIQFVKMLKL